ncbi:MAG: hypothetical protein JWM56_754 [Candidatus Peribacteria bacterium]|nr:hypothetical protein [Candidatus Peribacteria bacterium]
MESSFSTNGMQKNRDGGTFKVRQEWQDVAGKFANASPAIKAALRNMREVRNGN